MLKALYSRYRLKTAGGGLRPKMVRLDGWLALMGDARLVDAQFTTTDATNAFLWSRMHVIDEIKDYPRWGGSFQGRLQRPPWPGCLAGWLAGWGL
jgi:hypothetical protein